MIHPKSLDAAQVAKIELVEYLPVDGEQFGDWWTILKVGNGPSIWFWNDRAIPSGTVVRRKDGQLFLLDEIHLKPIGESE